MSQEVLYRKWRPQRFGDVAGQEPVTTTLLHAVAASAPAHAYLFSGPRGTGKTTTGRLLAKAVNCEATAPDGEPCNACASCESFTSGRALDLIELDAASNRGIDEIRDLREGAGYAPNSSRYKVYLIDEVHMLTDAAFNALLKTLEEPPPHVIFVLATTEPHRIPATIVSRCQRFDFRRIGLEATVGRMRTIALGEGIEVAEGGFELIARESTGSLRDAINLLDQTVAYHGRTLSLEAIREGLGLVLDRRTGELARASIQRDLASGLAVLSAMRDDGIEVRAFIREVIATLRSALLVKAGGAAQLGLSEGEIAELERLAEGARVNDIVAALRAYGDIDFRGDAYDPLPAEVAFASLAVGLEAPAGASAPVAVAPSVSVAAPSTGAARPSPQAPRERAARQSAQPRETRAAPPVATPPAARPDASASGAAAASVPQQAAPSRPAPAPFVPPDGGEASGELVEMRAKWDGIREAARKRHHKAGAMLNSQCYIKAVSGDTVEIGFTSRSLIEMTQNLEGGAVMQAIREVVAEAAGRPVAVVPVLWEELKQAGTAAPPRSAGGHLVDEALKQGAELMNEPVQE